MSTATVWTPPLLRPLAPAIELPTVPTPSQVRRTLGDPRVLSVLILVALIFVVGFRQSITRAIGTAGTPPAAPVPVAVHSVRVVTPTQLPHQGVGYAHVVKLHVPRDPFLPQNGAAPAGSYRVRSGDSLWAIARRSMGVAPTSANVSRAWQSLYATNSTAIGPNPSRLRVGVVLQLPTGEH